MTNQRKETAVKQCGAPVHSNPQTPCTFPAGHVQMYHQYDGTLDRRWCVGCGYVWTNGGPCKPGTRGCPSPQDTTS